MRDTMATAGLLAAAPVNEQTEFSRTGEVLRDIARGGISGVVAGIVVGGLGGRLVMRIAALLHPMPLVRSRRTGTGSATSRWVERSPWCCSG